MIKLCVLLLVILCFCYNICGIKGGKYLQLNEENVDSIRPLTYFPFFVWDVKLIPYEWKNHLN